MDPGNALERLSRITTLWTLLQQAHAGPADEATAARQQLMQRYCGTVYRYLLGALRHEDAALELFQEFVLRFLRGDFRRADPHWGRFRDYVKTVLIHLVNDYHHSQRERPQPLPSDFPAPTTGAAADADTEAQFLESWREELVTRAWAALAEHHPTFFAVLLGHVEHPEVPSPQMAQQLSVDLGKPLTAGHVRVTLHRARVKFAELLLDEVTHSLEAPTQAELVQELRDLGLLKYCGPALERRGPGSSAEKEEGC